jgi:hypothetical protein
MPSITVYNFSKYLILPGPGLIPATRYDPCHSLNGDASFGKYQIRTG